MRELPYNSQMLGPGLPVRSQCNISCEQTRLPLCTDLATKVTFSLAVVIHCLLGHSAKDLRDQRYDNHIDREPLHSHSLVACCVS